MTVGDADILPLIMVALSQDAVVGFGDGEAGDGQVLHLAFVFATDKDLRHWAIAAQGQPLDRTVAPANIERDVIETGLTAAAYLTPFLQNKSPAPVTLQGASNRQRFTGRQRDGCVNVVTNHTSRNGDRITMTESLVEGADPIAITVVVANIHGCGLPRSASGNGRQ